MKVEIPREDVWAVTQALVDAISERNRHAENGRTNPENADLSRRVADIARKTLRSIQTAAQEWDEESHPKESDRIEVDGHTIDLALGIYIEIGGNG